MRHNAIIARSGVQYYLASELPSLGLTSIPREVSNLGVFGVYRSAQCLKNAMGLFKGVPVMKGHDHWASGPEDPLAVGICADDCKLKMLKKEAVLSTVLDINERVPKRQLGELSPGYTGKYHWQLGTSPSGEEFQIVCDAISNVNHIALVPEARGGKDMKVLDGGTDMKKIRSGFLWFLKKKVAGVADGAEAPFITTLEDFKENRARWTDEEMTEHTNTLLALMEDLPDSEEKGKLQRFIADLPLLKDEDEAMVDEAVSTLMEFYNSLDKDAISDVMENTMEDPNKTDPTPEQSAVAPTQPESQVTPPTAPSTTDTVPTPETSVMDKMCASLDAMCAKLDQVLEAVKPSTPADQAPEATKDADPTSEPSKDEGAKDEAPKEEVKDEEPKTEEPKVGDQAPQMPLYTQTMQSVNTGADLDAVFNKMKERR